MSEGRQIFKWQVHQIPVEHSAHVSSARAPCVFVHPCHGPFWGHAFNIIQSSSHDTRQHLPSASNWLWKNFHRSLGDPKPRQIHLPWSWGMNKQSPELVRLSPNIAKSPLKHFTLKDPCRSTNSSLKEVWGAHGPALHFAPCLRCSESSVCRANMRDPAAQLRGNWRGIASKVLISPCDHRSIGLSERRDMHMSQPAT